jgi:hypothetical protein
MHNRVLLRDRRTDGFQPRFPSCASPGGVDFNEIRSSPLKSKSTATPGTQQKPVSDTVCLVFEFCVGDLHHAKRRCNVSVINSSLKKWAMVPAGSVGSYVALTFLRADKRPGPPWVKSSLSSTKHGTFAWFG